MIELPPGNGAPVEAANQARNLLPAVTVRWDEKTKSVLIEYDLKDFPHWAAVAMVLQAAYDLAQWNNHLLLSLQAQERMAQARAQAEGAQRLARKLSLPR